MKKTSRRIIQLILTLLAAALLQPRGIAADSRVQAQFDATFVLLEQADDARAAGERAKAIRLYGAAIAAYEELARRHPAAQPELVQFRIHYCRNQILNLQREASRSATSAAARVESLGHPLTPPVVESIALCRSGQFERAIDTLEPYLEQHPRDAVAHLLMGTAKLGLGELEESKGHLAEALAADPNLAEAHYNLSQLLVRTTEPDFESASIHYRSAIEGGVERDLNLEAVLGVEAP